MRMESSTTVVRPRSEQSQNPDLCADCDGNVRNPRDVTSREMKSSDHLVVFAHSHIHTHTNTRVSPCSSAHDQYPTHERAQLPTLVVPLSTLCAGGESSRSGGGIIHDRVPPFRFLLAQTATIPTFCVCLVTSANRSIVTGLEAPAQCRSAAWERNRLTHCSGRSSPIKKYTSVVRTYQGAFYTEAPIRITICT